MLLRTSQKDSSHTDTVASFTRAASLRLQGMPHEYAVVDSLGLDRGVLYRYRLQCVNVSPTSAQPFERIALARDTASARVPNAVITEVAAAPNPFTTETLITYRLDDRARVTAVLYDATGRALMRLQDNVEFPRGQHTLALDGTAIAPQGALVLILTARPGDDAAVEQSSAVVKLQRVR